VLDILRPCILFIDKRKIMQDFNRVEWDKREKAETEWLEKRYKEIMES